MRIAGLLTGLLFTAATFAQSIVTPVFVYKDGDASAGGYTGSDKDIVVDGGSQQNVGWITFQTQGIDFSKTGSAKLSLYVKSVVKPGTLQIRLLTSDITAPENNVKLSDIPAAAAVTDSIALKTTDMEKIIQLNLTTAVKTGAFKGVALTSVDGLSAAFDSKEGHLAPVILLTNNIDAALAGKVDTVSGKVLSDNNYTTAEKNKLAAISGTNTGDQDLSGLATKNDVTTGLSGKVDKVTGKGLSAKDYTAADSIKLAGIASDAVVSKGDMQYWDGTKWVRIPMGGTGQALTQSANQVPQWTNIPGTVTDIDGNMYRTIVIGNQEWTVTNLRTTHYNDGTAIPNVTSNTAWAGLTSGGYCYFNNTVDAGAQQKYGVMYNWYAVSTGKLAPAGWRVPDTTDWNNLENYLTANGYNYDGTAPGNNVAKSMAAGIWTISTNTGAVGNNLSLNNKSGFSALGGGYREYDGTFFMQSSFGCWWSVSEYNASIACDRDLNNGYNVLLRNNYHKTCGLSVRLVRDLN